MLRPTNRDSWDKSAPLTVTLDGGILTNGVLMPDTATGVLPLTINWLTLGAGAITIPALPVSIVYAPVLDAQQLNTASAATGISSVNTTTVTFSSENSATVPVDTNFQNAVDIEQAASTMATVLQKIPNGIAQGVGTALGTIGTLLRSSSATETNSTVFASQNTLQVGASQTLTRIASAKQGGPGVGDIIAYYYNARVLWYSDGGTMRVAIMGFDGVNQTTTGNLTAAWLRLKNQRPGTIDPVYHLDVTSMYMSLSLDPFFNGTPAGNPGAQLTGTRFAPVSNEVLEISGQALNYQATHQFSATDVRTQQVTKTHSETDKPPSSTD
jgi:hypothetical protein